jgi:hypothetical protein
MLSGTQLCGLLPPSHTYAQNILVAQEKAEMIQVSL